ncbi:MAG: serine protease [Hormoscilla sp. SP5CHS1]|nr:serine protease [Hormoscilla sp. SP5CHS1]
MLKHFSYGLSTALLGAAVVMVQPQVAAALTVGEIESIAKEITVKIEGPGAPGSGVIIAREGKSYYVLTAEHVVKNIGSGDEADVKTHDGQYHSLDISSIENLPGVDLAVIKFASDRLYSVATLSNFNYRLYKNRDYSSNAASASRQSAVEEEPFIFISGWPLLEESKLVVNPGILFDNSAAAISHPLVGSQGYELVYTNLSHLGMSGGPVLDPGGRVIGIHGRADGKHVKENDEIVGEFLEEEGGSVRVKVGLSLGIEIQTFLWWASQQGMSDKFRVENSPLPPLPNIEISSWKPPVSTSDPDNPLYLIDRGNQLWRLRRMSEALSAFDRAIDLKPDFYLAWFAKGFALGFDRQYAAALRACNRAIDLKLDYYDAWYCKAGALLELRQFDAALVALNRALRLQPDNSANWALQGELRFGLGQYRGALDSFDKAIEIRRSQGLPSKALLWNNRGFVLFKLQRYSEALASYDGTVELDPKYVSAWNNRGLTLHALGRYPEALTSFERAIKLDPNYQAAIENRDELLRQMGKLKGDRMQ